MAPIPEDDPAILSDEEEYDENADEDFNPDKANADGDEESAASSSDDDDTEATGSKKKSKVPVKRKNGATIDDVELDSGDEATIKERKRQKRRKKDADVPEDDDESAGEGGFILTRAQRQAQQVEKKERKKATLGHVSVDVDKLWAELSSLPVGRTMLLPTVDVDATTEKGPKESPTKSAAKPRDYLITIKKRIQYAGEVTEVEEQVPRSSKEAQRYLTEHPEADPDHALHNVNTGGLQRPLKRPSIFEPNPMSLVKGVAPEKLRPRAPSRLDVQRIEDEKRKKAMKMSTVQKSALDWRGFVDQEGLREELDEYGKSKKGFLGREAFLDKTAGMREQAAREARLKG